MLGHGPRTTEEKLRVAEALEQLLQLDAALASNALGWSAVREITRVATPRTEADWIAATRSLTVRDIERMVSGRRPGDRPADPLRPEARRHKLTFDVAAETLATFREALAKLRREAAGPIDDDDALLLMPRQVLGDPADAGRASYQIAMTVCESCRSGAQQGKHAAIALPATSPTWNGTDVRDVIATRGSIDFHSGYLSGDTWVSGPSSGSLEVPFELGNLSTGGGLFTLTIHDPVVTLHLSPDRRSADSGIIAGLLDTEEFVSALCDYSCRCYSGFCCDFREQLRQPSDSLLDGSIDPGATCNAISVGIAFTASAVQLGTPLPEPALPACP